MRWKPIIQYALIISLGIFGCGDDDNNPADSDPVVLEGEFDVSSQEDLNGPSTIAVKESGIMGSLGISETPFTTLAGLEGLTFVSEDFAISFNEDLTSLGGLESLTSVGGRLTISDNPSLTSLSGLEGLTSIDGCLEINGNNSLVNLEGLTSLTSVRGSLSVARHDDLLSLSGLGRLTSVGLMYINRNASLASLEGLERLTSAGLLAIEDNPLLPTAAVEALAERVTIEEVSLPDCVDD